MSKSDLQLADDDGYVTLTQAEFLKTRMALERLNAASLAKELGVHAQTIRNVTTQGRKISSNLALKLSKRFVEPVEVWLQDPIRAKASDVGKMALTAKRAKQRGKIESERNLPLFAHQLDYDRLLIDEEIERLLKTDGSGVSVDPFVPEHVQPASYDLTIGMIVTKGYRLLSEYEWVELLRREYHELEVSRVLEGVDQRVTEAKGEIAFQSHKFVLEPMKSVIVIAREWVGFGPKFMAEVGGTATNSMRGLIVSHGFQIDPGYKGPIIASVLNIGPDPFELIAGEKILSLAIRRLARAPRKAYLADIEDRIRELSEQIEKALRDLFQAEELLDGTGVKVTSSVLGEEYVSDTAEDAEDKAISSIFRRLAGTSGEASDCEALSNELIRIMGGISVDKKCAQALVRFLDVKDDTKRTALYSQFVHADDRKTLGWALATLKLDPVTAANEILENNS